MKLHLVVLALLCGASAAVQADPEHDRISSERSAANANLKEQERACGDQFVVAPCLEAARKDNRTMLTRLRREELQLDEAARHAAADARRKEIAEKAEAQQARASDARPEQPEVRVARPPRATPVPAIRPFEPPSGGPPGLGASGADRAEAEQRNIEKFEAKTREAQAHRDAVALRNAQRAAEGKIAAPLPVPPGASEPH